MQERSLDKVPRKPDIDADMVFQKALRFEALIEAHPDAASLHAESFQTQLNDLSNIETEWKDEQATPTIRAISARYRAEMETSLQVSSVIRLNGLVTELLSIDCWSAAWYHIDDAPHLG